MSHRYAAKTDTAQAPIVKALRKVGCTVTSLHKVGDGCPDLAVGRDGVTYLLEVKSSNGERKRTNTKQARWRANWRGGLVRVVVTEEEALRAVGIAVAPASGWLA